MHFWIGPFAPASLADVLPHFGFGQTALDRHASSFVHFWIGPAAPDALTPAFAYFWIFSATQRTFTHALLIIRVGPSAPHGHAVRRGGLELSVTHLCTTSRICQRTTYCLPLTPAVFGISPQLFLGLAAVTLF